MRRILHYSGSPTNSAEELSERAILGAWFELHRQGGCGAGEVRLHDAFTDRATIAIGDWLAFEYGSGNRWYLGRVISREATSPATIRLQLEGMASELDHVFPGGFGSTVNGIPPHRFAQADLFSLDPDYSEETIDTVSGPADVVRVLVQDYVVPNTNILYDADRIDEPPNASNVTSLKVRGTESVTALLRDLAVRARGAVWGVDETGTFFFEPAPTIPAAIWREASDLTKLEETYDRRFLFNRMMLVGDRIYSANSDGTQSSYRWQAHYVQPQSQNTHGERSIRLTVPWIRTTNDSRALAQEFFRLYAEPAPRFLVETGTQDSLFRPWVGTVRIENRDGEELVTASAETVRVQFDHSPRFQLQLGRTDPRQIWSMTENDHHGELPRNAESGFGGGEITLSSETSSNGSGNVVAFDQFTDTQGTLIVNHVPDIGPSWDRWNASWSIGSFLANAVSPDGPDGLAVVDTEISNAIVSARVRLAGGNSPGNGGLVMRLVNPLNYWKLIVNQSSQTLELVEVTAGIPTVRASTGVSIVDGSTVTFEATLNGTAVVGQVTHEETSWSVSYNSASSTGTSHGMWADYDEASGGNIPHAFDEFRVDSL